MQPSPFDALRVRPLRLCILLATFMLAGCWKGYLRADVEPLDAAESTAQISATDSYRLRLSTIKTLAIRAPESCLRETPAPECRLRLAEMERALAASGYRVISWETVQRGENRGGHAVYETAHQLGADAIILVNDLELPPLRADGLDQISVRYVRSDPEGDKLGEAQLRPAVREALDATVRQRFFSSAESAASSVKVVLNATVVLADSGEAIWFYRCALHPIAAGPSTFLFRGRDDDANHPTYRLVSPRRHPESEASASRAAPETRQQIEAELLQQVTSDLVARFRAGA